MTTPSFRDVEKLSVYLDGELNPVESARLESRLKVDPALASVLADLRQTRGLFRHLPQRRAPRNFTLTPKMVGQKPPLPRSYPLFRFASVAASLLLFFTFAANFMAPRLSKQAISAPYAYEMGSGDGGAGEEPALAMEVPAVTKAPAAPKTLAAPEMAPPAPAATQIPDTTADNMRTEPTPEAQEKPWADGQLPAESEANAVQPQRENLIPVCWQAGLALLALVSALIVFFMRRSAKSKWQAQK